MTKSAWVLLAGMAGLFVASVLVMGCADTTPICGTVGRIGIKASLTEVVLRLDNGGGTVVWLPGVVEEGDHICGHKRMDGEFALDQITEKTESRSKSFIFICKRHPPVGSRNWVEWLDKNGECDFAQ